jgi:hypothetical protein
MPHLIGSLLTIRAADPEKKRKTWIRKIATTQQHLVLARFSCFTFCESNHFVRATHSYRDRHPSIVTGRYYTGVRVETVLDLGVGKYGNFHFDTVITKNLWYYDGNYQYHPK